MSCGDTYYVHTPQLLYLPFPLHPPHMTRKQLQGVPRGV